jgi:hypothetical protein
MTITKHNKQRRCSVGRPYSIKLFSIADLNQYSGTVKTTNQMRRNEAPMLQQIYRLRPDSVGDKNGGIRANHSTKASDDAARVLFQDC